VRPAVAVVAALVALFAAAAALAGGGIAAGQRPPGAWFSGSFSGIGSAYARVDIDTTPAGLGIRGMNGQIPTRCIVRGKVRLPGRDGAIGIQFNLWDPGKTTGSRLIKPDGTFAFKFHHRADVAKSTTYTVWIRGTFSGASVRGRVKGVANDTFSGKCSGERSFTARPER
jgi:hypothetical protein